MSTSSDIFRHFFGHVGFGSGRCPVVPLGARTLETRPHRLHSRPRQPLTGCLRNGGNVKQLRKLEDQQTTIRAALRHARDTHWNEIARDARIPDLPISLAAWDSVRLRTTSSQWNVPGRYGPYGEFFLFLMKKEPLRISGVRAFTSSCLPQFV